MPGMQPLHRTDAASTSRSNPIDLGISEKKLDLMMQGTVQPSEDPQTSDLAFRADPAEMDLSGGSYSSMLERGGRTLESETTGTASSQTQDPRRENISHLHRRRDSARD